MFIITLLSWGAYQEQGYEGKGFVVNHTMGPWLGGVKTRDLIG